MIVVESGGTKSIWMFEDSKGLLRKEVSVGLHPREISEEKTNLIHSFIKENELKNRDVYFYGAGCESGQAKNIIQDFLNNQELKTKEVNTDIYAACVSHLGNNKGVVAILGTGAVAAKYDGNKVVKITSGWGYLLGDEGSGFDLGKRLLQLHISNQLPKEIKDEVNQYFGNNAILHRIYAPDGRKLVAGLAKIIQKFKEEKIIKQMIFQAFSDFCDTAIKPLQTKEKINFIGSVAYFFQEELRKTLKSKDYTFGEVKQEAIDGVFDFVRNNKGF
ncbi:MAG: BadF/BadG/BcrA/BcrD ATPase family protein [Brumimicrobium sp.]